MAAYGERDRRGGARARPESRVRAGRARASGRLARVPPGELLGGSGRPRARRARAAGRGRGSRHRLHPRHPPRRPPLHPVLALLPRLQHDARGVGPDVGARAGLDRPAIPASTATTGRERSSGWIPTAAPGSGPARTGTSRAANGRSAAARWARPHRLGPGLARQPLRPRALRPGARLAGPGPPPAPLRPLPARPRLIPLRPGHGLRERSTTAEGLSSFRSSRSTRGRTAARSACPPVRGTRTRTSTRSPEGHEGRDGRLRASVEHVDSCGPAFAREASRGSASQ